MKQTSWSISVSLFIHGSVWTDLQVILPDSSVLKGFLFQKAFDVLWTQWNPIYQGDFCFVWSSWLSYPFTACKLPSWVSRSAPSLQHPQTTPWNISEKSNVRSAFPRARFCRKSRNRGDLKNTRFKWFTPCSSHRHLQWIHHPLAELFKVITKNGNNYPKCECPFPWPGWE